MSILQDFIVVVSSRYFVRQGIQRLVAPYCREVYSFASLAEIEDLKSDGNARTVVILDLDGAETDIAVLSEMRSIAAARLIVFGYAGHEMTALIRRLPNLRAVLGSDIDPEKLVEVIALISSGYTIFPEREEGGVVTTPINAGYTPRRRRTDHRDLTSQRVCLLSPRELEVLGHMRSGLGNKRIATELDISETTVRLHVRSVLKKLKAENRTQAVLIAMEYPSDAARPS